MLTGTYKELLRPELESFKLHPEYLQDSDQVEKEINAVEITRQANRNICIFLWIIVSVTGLSCISSIACELMDLPPLFSNPAIKGCMASLLGFVPMLVYYTFQKSNLERKMLLLKLVKADQAAMVNA